MRFLLLTSVLLLLPLSVFAHGSGAYFESVVGAYKIDVGYSTPAPTLSESVVFDFQLRHADSTLTTGTDVPFEDVWLKITSDEDKRVVFASGLHNAEFGGPRLSYVFPKTGAYTLSVRYETADGSLAETSFPMTVLPDTSGGSFPINAKTGLPLGIGFAIGAGIVILLFRFNVLKAK